MPEIIKVPNSIYWTNGVDAETGKSINFVEVENWIDGSPMSDGKCDGRIYRKLPPSAGGGYVRRVYDGTFVNAEWFGIKPGGDYTSLIQSVLNVYPAVKFKAGTYNITQTLVLKTQSSIKGDTPQLLHNQGPKTVTFRGSTVNLGEGVPIIQCASSPSASQSISIENITFRGDTPADYSDLSTVPDTGIVGIDPSGVKEGLIIRNCCFRNLKVCIKSVQGHGYIDLVKLEDCMFRFNRRCIEYSSTVGTLMDSCMFYDNYSLGDTNVVEGVNCSFNNSSFSTNGAGLNFSLGKFSKLWIEGYNNVLQIKAGGRLILENSYLSETFSNDGSTKFYIRPIFGGVATIILRNVRFSINTRILNLNGYSEEFSTVNVIMEGCQGGSVFGHASATLYYYTSRGLNFSGKFNEQSWGTLEKSNQPILAGEDYTKGTGVVHRIPYLYKKIAFNDSISFRLSFPTEMFTEPFSILGLEYVEFTIVGCNNGAGGNSVYFTKLYIYNGYDAVWSSNLTGPSAANYAVTLSNQTRTAVDVLLTESHAGQGDILIVNGSTPNGKIEFL